ncbi:MAG: GlgC family sugar phosphate nucleotidyltransferase [Planctomycetota bacterium]|jgi:hypothetical protein
MIAEQPCIAVLLAGTLRPLPLHQMLGIDPLRLPIGAHGTLMEHWVEVLSRSLGDCQVRLIVNSPEQLAVLSEQVHERPTLRDGRVNVALEPSAWRGMAGALSDVTADARPRQTILAIEAYSLPPASLAPLVEALDDQTDAVVATTPNGEPAGLYALRSEVLEIVRPVGYVDVKEQLLPDLYEQGRPARTVQMPDPVTRIRDLDGYLKALEIQERRARVDDAAATRSGDARIAPTARIIGHCQIASGVVVDDDAIVHDSVLLEGARVGRGCVVSRSILGPRAEVSRPRNRPGRVVTGAVVPASPARKRDEAAGNAPPRRYGRRAAE